MFPSFDIALKEGEARENALRQILGPNARIEVKSQVKSRTHVFIEHESHGRPAGIATTEADYWVIETAPDLWSILDIDMLWLMYWAAIDRWGVKNGGEGNTSYGAAVPKAWLVGMR